jgi:hypothetical protein
MKFLALWHTFFFNSLSNEYAYICESICLSTLLMKFWKGQIWSDLSFVPYPEPRDVGQITRKYFVCFILLTCLFTYLFCGTGPRTQGFWPAKQVLWYRVVPPALATVPETSVSQN